MANNPRMTCFLHLWSMMDTFKILLLTLYLKPKASILEQWLQLNKRNGLPLWLSW